MVDLIGLIFTFYAVFTWAIASLVYKVGLQNTEPKATLPVVSGKKGIAIAKINMNIEAKNVRIPLIKSKIEPTFDSILRFASLNYSHDSADKGKYATSTDKESQYSDNQRNNCSFCCFC